MINGVPQLIKFDPKSVTLSHWPKLYAFIKKVKDPVYVLSSVPGRNVETGNILLVLKSAGRVELRSFRLLAKGCDEMTSIPDTTRPIGAKPIESRRTLSARLMNNCVVRVSGPAVAKVSVPARFDSTTASSNIDASRQTPLTTGVP